MGSGRRPGSRGRASLPLFDCVEGEVPAVPRDLRLLPEAVRIEPRVLPADGHPRIRLAFEFLDVVVGHGLPFSGRRIRPEFGRGVPESTSRTDDGLPRQTIYQAGPFVRP